MTAGARVRGEAQAGHLPVMFAQVMEGLQVQVNGTYLDGTFGRGGHARGVLQELGPGGRLLLMDKDPEAIAHAEHAFAGDARVAIHRGSFAQLAHWDATAAGLDGVLLDLGVSSPQLDVAERGFSFGKDGAELLTQVTVSRIGGKALTYSTQEGEIRELVADSVVLAIGARPDDRLAKELESVKVPVITAGDGAAIGYIEGALASGFAAGNRV